ncbi:prostate and testis expressed protein 14-like [Candoia aspera]|uniref:prostate and testis expressed protein 14-like n=1 Tax=Candoia aspera TaxID=51853 RepID=UPI002FD7FF38
MNKYLALGLWMLLSLTVVGGLTCYNCYREYFNGTCRTVEPPCQASPGGSCFRQKVFSEHTFLYISSGCALNCKPVKAGIHIHHINKCCSNANLCNRP